jgi:hypothetical protein
MVTVMAAEEPEHEELKRHQRDQEQAERELIQQAESEAEAERHRRRADKAGYLRSKLEEQERADREVTDDEGS